MFFFVGLFLLLSLSSLLGWLYLVVPQRMAHKRGRRAFVWILISLIATPVTAIAGLLWLGETSDVADTFS